MIRVNLGHRVKAYFPSVLSMAGKFSCRSWLQLLKAPSPMEVTVSGSSTWVTLSALRKKPSPIPTTVLPSTVSGTMRVVGMVLPSY